LFVTVTFAPALTVNVPENANPLIVIPAADADDPDDAEVDVEGDADEDGAVAGGPLAVAVECEDELQEESSKARAAAPAASARRLMLLTTPRHRDRFTVQTCSSGLADSEGKHDEQRRCAYVGRSPRAQPAETLTEKPAEDREPRSGEQCRASEPGRSAS
jgi:hypothetical protein